MLSTLRETLPDVDVLVVDDGSTNRTTDVSREHGAAVLSLGANRGLRVGIAAGYRLGARPRLRLLRTRRRRRPAPARGARPAPDARARQPLRRRGRISLRLAATLPRIPVQPERAAAVRHCDPPPVDGARAVAAFGDATSGLYAVNAKALPLLAEPFTSGAPEVEALIRVSEAGLRLEEVPVDMAERASGESKLRGSKAVKLVLTVAGTLAVAWLARRRRR